MEVCDLHLSIIWQMMRQGDKKYFCTSGTGKKELKTNMADCNLTTNRI